MLSTPQKAVDLAVAAVGERVRRLLAEGEDTGVAVARTLKIDPSRVSRWKTGEEIPLRYLPLLPKALGVDAHWLLTGEGSPTPRKPGEAEMRLETIRRLLSLGLRLATDAEVAELDRFLDSVLREVK